MNVEHRTSNIESPHRYRSAPLVLALVVLSTDRTCVSLLPCTFVPRPCTLASSIVHPHVRPPGSLPPAAPPGLRRLLESRTPVTSCASSPGDPWPSTARHPAVIAHRSSRITYPPVARRSLLGTLGRVPCSSMHHHNHASGLPCESARCVIALGFASASPQAPWTGTGTLTTTGGMDLVVRRGAQYLVHAYTYYVLAYSRSFLSDLRRCCSVY